MMGPSLIPNSGGGGGRYKRRYCGSQELTSSGTWAKAGALDNIVWTEDASLSEANSADVEMDVVAVGGGASGYKGGSNFYPGGKAGEVGLATIPFNDLPDTIEVVIAAGGLGSTGNFSNPGGDTSFGSLCRAAGGNDGATMTSGISIGVTAVPSMYGPGNGGSTGANRNGAASNYANPSISLAGGGIQANNGRPGTNSNSVFEFGSGGGGASTSGIGGKGGAPGGGGGSALAGPASGAGGQGAVYIKYYIWELAE